MLKVIFHWWLEVIFFFGRIKFKNSSQWSNTLQHLWLYQNLWRALNAFMYLNWYERWTAHFRSSNVEKASLSFRAPLRLGTKRCLRVVNGVRRTGCLGGVIVAKAEDEQWGARIQRFSVVWNFCAQLFPGCWERTDRWPRKLRLLLHQSRALVGSHQLANGFLNLESTYVSEIFHIQFGALFFKRSSLVLCYHCDSTV